MNGPTEDADGQTTVTTTVQTRGIDRASVQGGPQGVALFCHNMIHSGWTDISTAHTLLFRRAMPLDPEVPASSFASSSSSSSASSYSSGMPPFLSVPMSADQFDAHEAEASRRWEQRRDAEQAETRRFDPPNRQEAIRQVEQAARERALLEAYNAREAEAERKWNEEMEADRIRIRSGDPPNREEALRTLRAEAKERGRQKRLAHENAESRHDSPDERDQDHHQRPTTNSATTFPPMLQPCIIL